MIVMRLWTTTKSGRFFCDGTYHNFRESKWKGYFLFGIIPLFIKNQSNVYRFR